ncbi:MAG: hypothetical protein ACE5HJ_02680 [Thermoplasmata archaeon]
MEIEVTSSNGYKASAILGVDSGATEGYDRDFDAVEPLFQFQPRGGDVELTLYAYFYYPDNPETALGSSMDPEATVGLTTSVIDPKDNMTWPLQVAYLLEEDAVISLTWEPNVTRQLGGYSIELFTPFGEVLPMAKISNYSFAASRGVYDFTVRALAETEERGAEQQIIGGVITAYALVVAIILGLRRLRKGRRS